MIFKMKKFWPVLKNLFVPRSLNNRSSLHNGPNKKNFPQHFFSNPTSQRRVLGGTGNEDRPPGPQRSFFLFPGTLL
jgi:hypothetical protein